MAQEYVFDNAWREAKQRLQLLESLGDPTTIRLLEHLGVAAGWRCLEIGAGAGSIAAWIGRQVGPAGSVLATDLDTRFLEQLHHANLEVRRHDIASEALPVAMFDLVHARAVLTHLPDRRHAIDSMTGALRPGGWLLVEEVDCVSAVPDPRCGEAVIALFERGQRAMDLVLAAGGADRYYGRRLYGEVCAAGLTNVDSEGRTTMMRGGSPIALLQELTTRQARERLLTIGGLSVADADGYTALFADPGFVWMGNTVMSVWGQKPLGHV
jgi:SAM-dependent methyltransferase